MSDIHDVAVAVPAIVDYVVERRILGCLILGWHERFFSKIRLSDFYLANLSWHGWLFLHLRQGRKHTPDVAEVILDGRCRRECRRFGIRRLAAEAAHLACQDGLMMADWNRYVSRLRAVADCRFRVGRAQRHLESEVARWEKMSDVTSAKLDSIRRCRRR